MEKGLGNEDLPSGDPTAGYTFTTVNPAYFVKSRPQLISITWTYIEERPWSQPFAEAMRTKFNFAAVRKML